MPSELQLLGRAIKQAQYRQHRALDAALAPAGTTLVQWDALRAIDRLPGASAHALATATFQSDQAFGTLATRLEAQGLIARRPGQGRRITHHLTAAGRQTLEAGYPLVEAALGTLFADFPEPERAALRALLQRLVNDPLP
jgi:DNA-binding MarR family transcriptional regulator